MDQHFWITRNLLIDEFRGLDIVDFLSCWLACYKFFLLSSACHSQVSNQICLLLLPTIRYIYYILYKIVHCPAQFSPIWAAKLNPGDEWLKKSFVLVLVCCRFFSALEICGIRKFAAGTAAAVVAREAFLVDLWTRTEEEKEIFGFLSTGQRTDTPNNLQFMLWRERHAT